MKTRTHLFLVLSLASFACRDDTTNTSQPINTIQPGKRNYVWSIDSIEYGNLPSTIQLESIWGSSSKDVWGAAGDAPDVRDCLWHYDGVKWSRATAGTPITEFTGNKTVYAVWGSSKSDVWAAGRKINQGVLSGFLMHYDGMAWTDATPPSVSSLSTVLYIMDGARRDDIWAGGYEDAVHYDGSTWTAYRIADSLTVASITHGQGVTYFHLGSPWGKDTIYIFMFANSVFKMIDYTTITQRKFGGGLFVLGSKLKTMTNGIIGTTVKTDGSIDTNSWGREFTTPSFFRERYVQTSKNVFAVGQLNLSYHYNGTDWKQLIISVPNNTVDPHALLWGVWTDGNEVFICDTQNGIVYHGR